MKIGELGDHWRDAYATLLGEHRFLDAARVARFYRPAKLYKYYSFQSEHWRKNTQSHQIAFNLPSGFNDPLDSRWFLDYERIMEERFREIGEDWRKTGFGSGEMLDLMIRLNEEDLAHLHDLSHITCFSETPHSNLMWGHYARSHSGFCLEYDVARLPREIQILMPVVYVDAPYDASMLLDMRGIEDRYAALCPAIFKSRDWEYEREWRAFLPRTGSDPIRVVEAPGAISGVYLGMNPYDMPERDAIVEWAKREEISVYQMERSYRSFDLQSDEIGDLRSSKRPKGLLI